MRKTYKYKDKSKTNITFRDQYHIQRSISHSEINITFRDQYHIQGSISHSGINITFRDQYHIQRSISHSEINITFRDQYHIQGSIYFTICTYQFCNANLKGLAEHVCDQHFFRWSAVIYFAGNFACTVYRSIVLPFKWWHARLAVLDDNVLQGCASDTLYERLAVVVHSSQFEECVNHLPLVRTVQLTLLLADSIQID